MIDGILVPISIPTGAQATAQEDIAMDINDLFINILGVFMGLMNTETYSCEDYKQVLGLLTTLPNEHNMNKGFLNAQLRNSTC